MIKYLLVLADEAATSFCYYENPSWSAIAGAPMSSRVFAEAVAYARANGLALNVLLGLRGLARRQQEMMDDSPHVIVAPLGARGARQADIVVVNPEEVERLDGLQPTSRVHLVLRIRRNDVGRLPKLLAALIDRCERVNLVLVDIERCSDQDFDIYTVSLRGLVDVAASALKAGRATEVGSLTDRLLLTEMRNCGAGIDHVTVAPNGKFYLCPAFYHADAADSVGTLSEGLSIPNAQLLRRDHAPVCAICDAYQCRRCVYLNRTLTGEVNTPSRQQCVLSHLERDASRQLLAQVRHLPAFTSAPAIPFLEELDPLDRLVRSRRTGQGPQVAASPWMGDLGHLTDHELLLEILRQQREILTKLGLEEPRNTDPPSSRSPVSGSKRGRDQGC